MAWRNFSLGPISATCPRPTRALGNGTGIITPRHRPWDNTAPACNPFAISRLRTHPNKHGALRCWGRPLHDPPVRPRYFAGCVGRITRMRHLTFPPGFRGKADTADCPVNVNMRSRRARNSGGIASQRVEPGADCCGRDRRSRVVGNIGTHRSTRRVARFHQYRCFPQHHVDLRAAIHAVAESSSRQKDLELE